MRWGVLKESPRGSRQAFWLRFANLSPVHACMQDTPHHILSVVFEAQLLDCYTVQKVRATCSQYSSVRAEHSYLKHTALQYGFDPIAVLAWPRSEREDWFPLPKEALSANAPLCIEHTAPRGYVKAVPECYCVVENRRQTVLSRNLSLRIGLRNLRSGRYLLREDSQQSSHRSSS